MAKQRDRFWAFVVAAVLAWFVADMAAGLYAQRVRHSHELRMQQLRHEHEKRLWDEAVDRVMLELLGEGA